MDIYKPIFIVDNPDPEERVKVTYNYSRVNEINWNINRDKHTCHVQNIACFDIEASTGYYNPKTNKIRGFSHKKYDHNNNYRKAIDGSIAVSLPYIWQYLIESADGYLYVFLGRDFKDYEEFINLLTARMRYCANCTKKDSIELITYIHNLSYEFGQFFRNVFKKMKVTARTKRKPMKFRVTYNKVKLTHKCSLFLFQKSLDACCRDEKIPTPKLHPTRDFYLPIRTPITPLDDFTIDYAVCDVVSMFYLLEKYRSRYEFMECIPMTATGEVRNDFKHLANEHPEYAVNCYIIAQSYSYQFFCKLILLFQGGWTHANAKYAGRVLTPSRGLFLTAYDFASSYPAVMCSYAGFPISQFIAVDAANFSTYAAEDVVKPQHAWFARFRFTNVRSKYDNSLWSYSKALNKAELSADTTKKIDNGRIHECAALEIYATNLDFDIFRQVYDFDYDYDVTDLYVADAGYLPRDLVMLILSAYKDKTELKEAVNGMSEEERASRYGASKRRINSAYGVFVTALLSDLISYDDADGWNSEEMTEDDYYDMLDDMKPGSTITYYSIGIWCTAAARWRLWTGAIIPNDRSIAYCDTDSTKGLFSMRDINNILDFNKRILQWNEEAAAALNIDPAYYAPKTPKGKVKPLGVFALDTPDGADVLPDGYSVYKEFKTLGSKKYVYEDSNGVIHSTIAGLPKEAGPKIIKSCDDFKLSLKWDSRHSGKLCAIYNDNQPELDWVDCCGNSYHSTHKYGIALKPIGFSMDKMEEYMHFIDWIRGVKDDNYTRTDYTNRALAVISSD